MGEIVMKTKILIFALAALAFMASCSKPESSSRMEGNTVPVEFNVSIDSLGQTKDILGYGSEWIFEFSFLDTIYVKPFFKDEEQAAEQIYHYHYSSNNICSFVGTWKEWKAGSRFDFYYPTSLGRNGFVSLKNQAGYGAPYPLKGHCTSVRPYSVNKATLHPLGAVLRVSLNEDRKISINARTEDGRFVVGIDSTGAAMLAPPEATAEESAIFETDRCYYNYRIVVPAGIKLSFFDGETKLKTTRDSGFAPGTWASISFGEDAMQVVTLPATDVSSCRSTLQGKIISNQDITQPVYFVMSTDREAVIRKIGLSEIKATLGQGGSFSCVCNLLSSNTTYFYAAYYAGRMGKILSFSTPPFSPDYTFVDPKHIVHFTSAVIWNNLKTDDPDVYATRLTHCLYSKTYSTKEEIIQNGKYGGAYKITGLERGTTYYYVPVFSITSLNHDYVLVYGDVNSFTTLSSDADYGEAVDLGLSVKWRTCNLGADTPEEPGEEFKWGETAEPLSYEELSKYGDGKNTVLIKEDDTAHYLLGGNWRMPTREEFDELTSKCTLTYINDSKGQYFQVQSKVPDYTDKFIILPISEFWTSSCSPLSQNVIFYSRFSNYSPFYHVAINGFQASHYIRPVCDSEN